MASVHGDVNADPTAQLRDASAAKGGRLVTTAKTMDLTDSFHLRAADEARTVTLDRFQNSSPFGSTKSINMLPTFSINELTLGKRLGKGGFSNVYEIRGIQLPARHNALFSSQGAYQNKNKPIGLKPLRMGKLSRNDTVAVDNDESKRFMAEHCYRRSGDARYAIKQIRPDVLRREDKLMFSLCDLAIETRFLSGLEHPNVIKLRAISTSEQFTKDFFIILDRLYDTLTKRLEEWKSKERRLSSMFLSRVLFRDPKKKKRLELFESRLGVVFDLSDAFQYLHEQRVIHRDIKPENIGFDCRGDVKIFDFGLARELRVDMQLEDGTFQLSKMTGSLRYMAPEVCAGQSYSSACDVYSFGIMVWEIVTLQKAFDTLGGHKEDEFVAQVFNQELRPSLDGGFVSHGIKNLLEGMWCPDQFSRLSMEEVHRQLWKELVLLRSGDSSGIPTQTRRRRSSSNFDFLDLSLHSHGNSRKSGVTAGGGRL